MPEKLNVPPFSSNEVRLSARQWIVAGVITVAVFVLTPILWERVEKFEADSDYRIPYELSSDYWMYGRYCRAVCSQDKTLVIGDSVIWGQYVNKEQTLSHYLNEFAGEERFVNMGADGAHPVAIAGLLTYYGKAISGKNVILYYNLLWMSSARHDLQAEKEFRFNHPKLAPQFIPRIPCYRESFSNRVGIAIERCSSFLGWMAHLQTVYFENLDLASWTLEHPYKNPLKQISLQPVTFTDKSRHEPVAWTDRGVEKQDLPWVTLESSLQWRFFRQGLEALERRGNRVFVVVGPFNEHMLKEKSLGTYHKIKSGIEAWLQQKKIAYYAPSVLPSQYYADASHPLSEGYRLLAKQLFENESFSDFKRHFTNSAMANIWPRANNGQ